jgi:anti-sigma factor NepR-like protein
MNERKPVGQQNPMEAAATRNKKSNSKPAMYDEVVNQGVPDRFNELINRLNGDDKKGGH